jgi:hypothetical protein
VPATAWRRVPTFERLEDRVTSNVPSVSIVMAGSGPATGGNSVSIYGQYFTGATAVDFGSTPAVFYVVSDSTITATVLAESAGTVYVTATTPGGTSPANNNSDEYTYYTVPTVTAVTPNTGPTGGEAGVVIAGTGFTRAISVCFGSLNAFFTVNSATQITAAAPASMMPGTVDVTVETQNGTSPASKKPIKNP